SIGGVYAKNIAMWTSPNAIPGISDNNAVSVYPVPSSKSITVHVAAYTNDMQYVVYNELGQQVENGIIPPSKTSILDISSYSSGLYLLSVKAGAKAYNTRFIKN
ncbi:MAG TPA: T9SS type A sorting domain-containing protein, partial [Bacteroidia bacterium]|nr:T9SS type A sorting domain-containing protein [Bacteroidia bacterium]